MQRRKLAAISGEKNRIEKGNTGKWRQKYRQNRQKQQIIAGNSGISYNKLSYNNRVFKWSETRQIVGYK